MLDMIRAEEARQIAASANPEEAHAEADTMAENAMGWATRNAMARTNTRVRMYAKYGRTSLAVKFAPGELDGKGTGNSFYNDLLANSNTQVADAICAIIYVAWVLLNSPRTRHSSKKVHRYGRPRD